MTKVPKKKKSPGEAEFALLIRSMDWPHNIPHPMKTNQGQEGYEYRFLEDRKWTFDFAWPSHKVAVEVEGGHYTKGGHSQMGSGWKDMEKYNVAQLKGWIVLRATPDMVAGWVFMEQLTRALELRNPVSGKEKIIEGRN